MTWQSQDEHTFEERLRRIEALRTGGWWKRGTPGRRRRRSVVRLPLRLLVISVALVIALKSLALATVSEGEYRAALRGLPEDTLTGEVLRVVFGPDPVSQTVARMLRF